jgi:RNA polymerase-binding transcription factor DksA
MLERRLTGDIADLAGEALRPAGGEMSGNLSHLPRHQADLGTDYAEQVLTLSLLENDEHLLEEVHAALERLGGRWFGRCEACRRAIPGSRLRAVPYARYCFRCARRFELSS